MAHSEATYEVEISLMPSIRAFFPFVHVCAIDSGGPYTLIYIYTPSGYLT